jgi:pimeloyl-ACP methyl ester carboxylesterase
VPLDRADPASRYIEVAITRPELVAGDTRRPLVFDPGGPGGSGIDLVRTLTDVLPPRLLDHYYPVGWDPRGVGRSDPAVDCGLVPPDELPDPEECLARTGDLLAEVGAPDAAADLDDIRAALGVERLDYVGYSYGTALGAVFAMLHPDRVGRFVLDGAFDPEAARDDRPGIAMDETAYAADGVAGVVARFHELCDATSECAAGPSSADSLDELAGHIADVPTPNFSGAPDAVDALELDAVVAGAMLDPWSWGLIGDALAEAAGGDASSLAALSQWVLGDPQLGFFDDANFAIFCADFSHLDGVAGCAGMPEADHLPVVTEVDVDTPILVIGTRHDPLTPGRHAEELAAALGDAVTMTWDGVGHTAFPVSECVDDAVTDYLVDGTAPEPDLVCPFVDGLVRDRDIGRYLFEYPPEWVRPLLEEKLLAEGIDGEQASCLAGELDRADHRVITHVLLGVTSSRATAARLRAESSC